MPLSAEGQNRLGGESSPYLLQHADNPVWWYPWGEAAFEAALGWPHRAAGAAAFFFRFRDAAFFRFRDAAFFRFRAVFCRF